MIRTHQEGFTLIEVVVTTFICVLIAAALISNLSQARISITQTTLRLVDVLRQAQSMALAGALTSGGVYPCGYGITFTATTYTIFAAPVPIPATGCTTIATTYTAGYTIVSGPTALPYASFAFSPIPADIFFQPPLATVYVGGTKTPAVNPTVITIKNGSASCPGTDCRTISVYTSGRIEQQ